MERNFIAAKGILEISLVNTLLCYDPTMESYLIPSHTQTFDLEIKRSRFITSVAHADSIEKAKAFIQHTREYYPDANHNCWAYVAGTPTDLQGVDQSDDGEPKDTAGKPILNVLQHSNLGHTVIVVTRYFGGIKLGAGGLVRAYSQSASNAIKNLITKEHVIKQTIDISLPYNILSKIEYWLDKHSIDIVNKNFDNDVKLSIAVPINQLSTLDDDLNSLSNGTITLYK